eukprot:scaffold107874_cov28-Tisochrysis_lutea.AAC.1
MRSPPAVLSEAGAVHDRAQLTGVSLPIACKGCVRFCTALSYSAHGCIGSAPHGICVKGSPSLPFNHNRFSQSP